MVNANVGCGMGAGACWLLIKRTGWVTFVLGCRRLKSRVWTKRRRTGGYKEHVLYKDMTGVRSLIIKRREYKPGILELK